MEASVNEIPVKDLYKMMIGSIIPRPIAWITTSYADGIVNIAPFSFFNMVSGQPPIVSVSILRNNGQLKDTARNLISMGEAVIHIVDEDNVDEVNQTAAPLAFKESEAEAFGIELENAETVKVPRIKNSRAKFEVKLYQHIEIKDFTTNTISADLFLLEICYVVLDENVYHNGYVLPKALKPLARLAGNDYAGLGKILTIKRPGR